VPVDTINRVVPRLIAHGRYLRPSLGILSDDALGERLLAGSGIQGVLVLRVERGSAAARAGLRGAEVSSAGDLVSGDVILAVDGARVGGIDELIEVLDRYRPGDAVTLSVVRGGRTLEMQAVLGSNDQRTGSVPSRRSGATAVAPVGQASGFPAETGVSVLA
jgi:S1-C subfamily serine protease